MTKARLTLKGTAIHCQQTTDNECHAEDIHRQLVDEIVPAVVKVVRPIVSDSQQRGADGKYHEAAEEQQVEQRAERFFMDAFLRRCVNSQPLQPHTPVALESALLTFTPVP